MKTKPTAEFTEAVEISEVVSEEQQIQEEVRFSPYGLFLWLTVHISLRDETRRRQQN